MESKYKSPVFTGNVVILLWTLFFLGAVVYHYTQKHQLNRQSPAPVLESGVRAFSPSTTSLKIPPPLLLTQGEGSPGKITFQHETHLSKNEVNCYQCHANFSILGPDAGSTKKPSHESCGVCHNGTQAFSTGDDCSRCHTTQ